MRTITSASGQVETVTMRRSESADARGINSLICPSTQAVFGTVDVIHVLEKANLAVTLANEKDDILAHASFSDHPVGDLVDQAHWELFLHKHFNTEQCTPLNTLFLHLFVAQMKFATECIKEIMRAVFNAITELEYICLVSPNISNLEPALNEMFEPLQRLTDTGPSCLALICHRHNHCPRLHIRPARVDDHDDIMHIVEEQTKLLSVIGQPYVLAELIEAQNEENHTAVCEVSGVAAGFISVTAKVDLKQLHDNFELTDFNGLYKLQPAVHTDAGEDEAETQSSPAQRSNGASEKPRVFCIQFFIIEKNSEMRSVDFIPYIFKCFPDLDFCIITVPTLSPEFPLLQSFLRVLPLATSLLHQELYIAHATGLRWLLLISLFLPGTISTSLSDSVAVLLLFQRWHDYRFDMVIFQRGGPGTFLAPLLLEKS